MEFLLSGFLTINQNLLLRTLLGAFMLSCFLKICSMHKVWLILTSFSVSLGISLEMISITTKGGKPLSINPLLIAIIYATIFLFNTLPALLVLSPERKSLIKLSALRPAIFALYSIGLILSIISLNRDTLASQLILLTVTHTAAFICSSATALSISNLTYGKFFYAYPALLVIANDAFAYFVGKAMGRTPLISLSPNKTVEGFVGGFFFTFIVGLALSYLKVNGLFLSDSFDLRLPGHGGMTDRFDCQLLMVFFTYHYIRGVMDLDSSLVNVAYRFFISNMGVNEIQKLMKMLDSYVTRK